ncbi:MAG: ArnT family glycosyltransferase [Chloroflexota bacterium]
MEAIRGLALAAYVLVCALPVGLALLRLARVSACGAERFFLAGSLGLGAIAYSLTLLGLSRAFWSPVVVIAPAVIGAASAWWVRGEISGWMRWRNAGTRAERSTGLALGALAMLVVVSGLAPPSDYDGLLYHLVAPRTYLESGDFAYISHNFSANLPAFGEMLFAVGLAGGSDRAPQLIHAGGGAAAVGLTWVMGRRVLPGRGAVWAALGLAGTPLVPFLATRAYIDLFTVAFVTAATLLVLLWMDDGERGALLLAGVALGFAISSKYAALVPALPLGLVVILLSLKRRRGNAVGDWAALVSGAALAALPWTVRQTALLGNPLWPLYFGGRDWDATRVEQLTYFVSQYGSGKSLREWLLLPFNVFRESWRFGHVPWSFPPALALATPLAAFDRRPAIRWLLFVAGLTGGLWARGWQDLRFLLSVYPLLAVLGVAGLYTALRAPWGERVAALIACALFAVTSAREGARAFDRIPVVVGLENTQAYLARQVSNHAALTFLNERASVDSSALFLGDGQLWYCRPRCIPDPAHDNLLTFFLGGAPDRPIDLEAAAARLKAERVEHVLLSKKDFWYLEHQDPENRLRRQLADFYVFKSRYLDIVYEDDLVEVYLARW